MGGWAACWCFGRTVFFVGPGLLNKGSSLSHPRRDVTALLLWGKKEVFQARPGPAQSAEARPGSASQAGQEAARPGMSRHTPPPPPHDGIDGT